MLDWVATAVVLIIGFTIMVTGWIEYILLAWLGILLILVVMGILGRIWACFRKRNDK
ncbi:MULTISPECIES: hypothetical protein [Enterobacteriaceae]|uniref:Uncharacterized protein n=1 Tax=Klebsiella grimontii TaxID=2058152 RepID=A0ABD7AK99_9ENTR|nr:MULTISPECIES: hypothetical protein [Enterobacteriaceae]QLO53218.1 hypothetical protein HV234_17590 [Klebsiella grimontii]WPO20553.1 hypothetical protein SH579_06395 [Raoultella ornithinolytica]